VTLWPFMPEDEPTEALVWDTHVIKTRTAEQRLARRPIPTQEWDLTFHLDASDFALARQLARDLSDGNEFDIPVWTEQTEAGTVAASSTVLAVDATNTCYKAGGQLVVWSSSTDNEVCTILSIGVGTVTINPGTTAEHTNALIMPVRDVRFADGQEVEFTKGKTPNFVNCVGRFEAVDTEDLSAESGWSPVEYLSDDVLDRVMVLRDIRDVQTRESDRIAAPGGEVWVSPIMGSARQTSIVAWNLADASAIWDFRVWLHQKRGRLKRFWVPSFNADLVVVDDIAFDATTITIQDVDFAANYGYGTDFVVITTAGVMYGFRVTNAAAGGAGEEVLTIAAPLGTTVTVAEIAKTSNMLLSRFDADRIEIQHLVGGKADVIVPVVEVPD